MAGMAACGGRNWCRRRVMVCWAWAKPENAREASATRAVRRMIVMETVLKERENESAVSGYPEKPLNCDRFTSY